MRNASRRQVVRAATADAQAHAGVADQDSSCEHGTEGCPGPGGELDALCFDCFIGAEEDDA